MPVLNAATMRPDVSNAGTGSSLCDLAKSRFGGAHRLFNNAGVVWSAAGVDDTQSGLGMGLLV